MDPSDIEARKALVRQAQDDYIARLALRRQPRRGEQSPEFRGLVNR